MATVNDQAQLLGLFKQVYAEKIRNAWLMRAPIASSITFEEQTSTGDNYNAPIDLQLEQGITYAAGGTLPSGTGYLSPTAGKMENAQLTGAQYFGRSQVAYEAISRSARVSAAAFEKATSHIVKRLMFSMLKRFEIDLLHGQLGWGTIESVSGAGATRAFVISDASWAAGIWSGMKDATLDCFAADYSGAKINTTTAITITSIVPATRTINVSGLDAELTNCVAGCHFFPRTQTPTTALVGLTKWASLTSASGTFANIATGSFELWQSNQYDVAGQLSMQKVLAAVSMAFDYGLITGGKLIVSGRGFEQLNTDQAALRQYDVSYKPVSAQNGVEKLIYSGTCGDIEIMPHWAQKPGQALFYSPEPLKRIGSEELGFITRAGGEKLILESSDSPATEMRMYGNQNLFCDMPRHLVSLTGITS